MIATVHYDRAHIERELRPLCMWFDIKAGHVTIDNMDRVGYFLSKIYDALADYLLEYVQRVTCRSFEEICDTHLSFPYNPSEVHPNELAEFFAVKVYPTFDRIGHYLSGPLGGAVQYLNDNGHDPDNAYFYHHDHKTAMLVVTGIDQKETVADY